MWTHRWMGKHGSKNLQIKLSSCSRYQFHPLPNWSNYLHCTNRHVQGSRHVQQAYCHCYHQASPASIYTISTVSFTTLIPHAFKEKHAAKIKQQEWQRNEPLCSYLTPLSLSLFHIHLFHLCWILLPLAHKDNRIVEAANLCFIWNQSRKKPSKTYKSKTKSFDFCVHVLKIPCSQDSVLQIHWPQRV